MSTVIDEKIVSMKFNNQDFERNVQTSLSTLDKLKSALNFDNASKTFASLREASKNVNFDGFANAIDGVQKRFSALEVIGVTALANITNSVINTGKQMLESLSVKPISEGFDEYELKMGAVQNIMNGSGQSLDVVMEKLEELNKYADDTIYSFSDMTNNIGKFTNAGVELNDAVDAIKGISNAAALSGSNAQQASHAMYNFAQALSGGYVKLIDWMSIENAQMATVGFKDELLKTAAALHTVEEQADGTYKVLTANNKGAMMDETVSAKNFRDSLNYQWLTSEVLIETLKKYGNAETDVGAKAQQAATEIKTFTQMMDTLKEAVGSGWAVTWEYVFGNFDEAKALWTEVGNAVQFFINAQADARNSLLKGWKDLGGRTVLIEALRNCLYDIGTIIKPIAGAFRDIFPRKTSEQLYGLTENFKLLSARMRLSNEQMDVVRVSFQELFDVVRKTGSGVKYVGDILISAFREVFSESASQQVDFILGLLRSFSGTLTELTAAFRLNADQANDLRDGFVNVFSIVKDLISAVASVGRIARSAFDELFPQRISDRITSALTSILGSFSDLTGRFRTFIQEFRLTEDQAEKLKTGFKGLITFGRILKTVFDGIIDSAKNILPSADEIGVKLIDVYGKLLDKFGDFGSYIMAHEDEITSNIQSVFTTIITKVRDAIDSIKKAFDGFGDIDLSGIDAFVDKVKEHFHPLEMTVNFIKSIFDKISYVISNIGPILLTGLKYVVYGISKLLGYLSTNLESFDLSKVLNFIQSGVAITFLYRLQDALKVVNNVKGVTGILKDLRETLETYQKNLNSKILLNIAIAVAILAASLVALSFVDTEKMLGSLGALGVMFAMFTTSFKKITALLDPKNLKNIIPASVMLISLATSILILSIALNKFSSLEWDQILKGAVGVGALLAMITAAMNYMPKQNTAFGMSQALGLLLLAGSIKVLSDAVLVLSEIDTGKLVKGLLAAGGLIAGLVAFLNLLPKDSSFGVLAGVGILLLAESLKILTSAVVTLSELKSDDFIKGLGGVAVLIAMLSAFMMSANKSNFGASGGVGLILMAAGLKVLADVVKEFGQMDLMNLAVGLGALLAVILELGLGAELMVGALPGAAAMLVMAASLNALVPVLQKLGDMSLLEIIKSLGVLAGIFVLFGVAGASLAPILPVLLGLGAALFLMGSGLAFMGIGLSAISVSLPVALGSIATSIGAIILIIKELLSAVPDIIASTIVSIITSVGEVLGSVLSFIEENGPAIIRTILAIVDELLVQLAEHAPSMFESLWVILAAFLTSVRDHIGEVTAVGLEIVAGFLVGIAEGIDDIIQAAWNIVIALIDGLAAAFGNEDNVRRLRDSIINLLKSMLEAVLVFFGIHSPSTVFQDIGVNLIEGLILGIGNMVDNAVGTLLELGTKLVDAIASKYEDFKATGEGIVNKVKEGVENFKSDVKASFDNMIDSLKDFSVDDFVKSGKNILEGLKDGLKDSDALKHLTDTAKSVFGTVRDVIAGVFDEHSPSRVTYQFGRYVVEGFSNGISDYANLAYGTMSTFGNRSLDAIDSTLGALTEVMENGIDYDPTISPVLDLSSVTSGISDLNSMMKDANSLQLAASANFGMNSILSRNQNGVVVNNIDVVQAISEMRSDFGAMVNAIRELQIVMDTGSLVGAISQPMDEAFGRMAIMNERGI